MNDMIYPIIKKQLGEAIALLYKVTWSVEKFEVDPSLIDPVMKQHQLVFSYRGGEILKLLMKRNSYAIPSIHRVFKSIDLKLPMAELLVIFKMVSFVYESLQNKRFTMLSDVVYNPWNNELDLIFDAGHDDSIAAFDLDHRSLVLNSAYNQ